jgi:Primase C terminal 1 (PriCT-1)
MLPDLYPSIHQAHCFLEALHAPLHYGEQIELRWNSPDFRGSMRRNFYPSTEAAAHEAVSLGVFCDVYVGVAPRWDSDGTRAGVRRLGAVWADLDAKGEHTVGSRLRQLQDLTCHPSILVLTGGGCHAYWLLTKPADGLEQLERAEGLMRWLGQGLGGDPVWDRARILRVPSTFNYKYELPRPVELERLEPRLRYDLDELEEMAKAFPEEGAPEGVPTSVPTAGRSSVRRDALAAPIPTGERNVTLASVAGSLRDRGLDEGTIPVVLLEVNRLRCDPPLDATEVLRIARSVGRYAVGSPRYRSSPVRRVRRNVEEV